ncbi:hypothetical protein GE09DRAFT_1053355 [Coniochaeta sp. 2T2.1]|nr:hypothetical protein GE09DRAFT_1053355 [Coniochaeta sp. 2T2.1]
MDLAIALLLFLHTSEISLPRTACCIESCKGSTDDGIAIPSHPPAEITPFALHRARQFTEAWNAMVRRVPCCCYLHATFNSPDEAPESSILPYCGADEEDLTTKGQDRPLFYPSLHDCAPPDASN